MRRLFVLALVALALPAAGTAAFPGTNGRLLFLQEQQLVERRSSPPALYPCATTPAGVHPARILELPTDRLTVSADGARLAFTQPGGVYVSEVDGTGARRLAAGGMPAWTPDSSQVVLADFGDIYVVRTDGGDRLAITSDPRWDQMPAVSPDGRTIAYVRGARYALTGEELVVRDLGGGNERVLVSAPGIAAPDWAPDGLRVAFALGSTISTVAANGGDLRTLAAGTEPAYSPDGTLIAFERDGDIWTMSPRGTGAVNVTRSPVQERQPAWQTGAASRPAGSDRPCAIVGTDVGEELVGSEYDDAFYDLGGDDTIRGLGGNDRVFDGEGIDRIEGGGGNDEIYLRQGANTVFGGPGNDQVSGSAGLASFFPADLPQTIHGEDGNDLLWGGAAADRIEGGPGNDTIDGLRGPDILLGGPGNDRLVGNRGDDSLQGNQGDDVLFGGLTRGRPRSYDGYDLLVGGEGNDRLAGGWQTDRLFGGPGNDRLAGGANADYLLGEAGLDEHLGEGGDDLLLARDARRERVSGGPGFDRARLDPADRRLGVERAIR